MNILHAGEQLSALEPVTVSLFTICILYNLINEGEETIVTGSSQ